MKEPSFSLASCVRQDNGQSLLEYALVIVLVSLVVIVALTLLRDPINQAFQILFRRFAMRDIPVVVAMGAF